MGVGDIVQYLSHPEAVGLMMGAVVAVRLVIRHLLAVVVVLVAEAVVAAAVVVLVAEAVVAAAVDMKAEVVNLRFFYLYCH